LRPPPLALESLEFRLSQALLSLALRRHRNVAAFEPLSHALGIVQSSLVKFVQLVGLDEPVLVFVEPVEAGGGSPELVLADLAISVLIASQDEDLGKTVSVATPIGPRIGRPAGIGGRRGLLAVGMTGLVRRFQFLKRQPAVPALIESPNGFTRFRFILHTGTAHELDYGDESVLIHIKSFEDKFRCQPHRTGGAILWSRLDLPCAEVPRRGRFLLPFLTLRHGGARSDKSENRDERKLHESHRVASQRHFGDEETLDELLCGVEHQDGQKVPAVRLRIANCGLRIDGPRAVAVFC